MSRDKILLTPGPLTTTLRTKLAMLNDWGSWDNDFKAVTAKLRAALLDIIKNNGEYVVIPMQGSGTFSVEAAIGTVLPRDGHILVLDNGAYCKRMAAISEKMDRQTTLLSFPESEKVNVETVRQALEADKSITHIGLIHCETGTGIINPLKEISDLCREKNVGLIIDAMSSFGAYPIEATELQFDALIAASGKCLEGVPGMGFVFLREAILESCAHNSPSIALDLYDQYHYMEKTGQWRFTPPTHVMVALYEAILQFFEEGGQPARLARYQNNSQALLEGMRKLGIQPFLKEEDLSAIIITFLAPDSTKYDFKVLYDVAKSEGFMLYPGKLTEVETFRVGSIGAITDVEMRQAVNAVEFALKTMDGAK